MNSDYTLEYPEGPQLATSTRTDTVRRALPQSGSGRLPEVAIHQSVGGQAVTLDHLVIRQVAVFQARFRKSSYSGFSGCVEVARMADGKVALRDSKNPSLSARIFDTNEWSAFIDGVKAGEFDLDVLDR